MPQLSRTANDLIVQAFYRLGEFAVGETIPGADASIALTQLNLLLDDFSSSGVYIPYVTEFTFNMIPGQASYSVSDIISADITNPRIVDLLNVNLTLNDIIIFPIRIVSRTTFSNMVRINQPPLSTRPGMVFLDEQPFQSFLTFYPSPDQAYPISVNAKCMINEVSYTSSLQFLPPYFWLFLQMALARDLKSFYPSGNWPAEAEDKYQKVFRNLRNANELDLTITPSAILNSKGPMYWANIFSYP